MAFRSLQRAGSHRRHVPGSGEYVVGGALYCLWFNDEGLPEIAVFGLEQEQEAHQLTLRRSGLLHDAKGKIILNFLPITETAVRARQSLPPPEESTVQNKGRNG